MLSFNDIPEAITLILHRQESLERQIESLKTLIKDSGAKDHHYPMSVEETAKYLNVPVATVYEKLAKGEIPACKSGKHWEIYRDEIDMMLEANRINKVPLTAEQMNAQILASNRRKPKNVGKYDHLLSPPPDASNPSLVSKGLSHQSGTILR